MNYREILIRLMSMTSPFVYDSEESFLEMLRKFYKYLHDLTVATKEMSDDIDDLRTEIGDFETEVRQLIANINAILAEYDLKLEKIKDDLYLYVDTQIINLRTYVDSQYAILDARITDVEIGKIDVYDPTTGLLSPIQTVIDNLYDMNRGNAITASEYDALELTATAYDNYELTAREYDINAKALLV